MFWPIGRWGEHKVWARWVERWCCISYFWADPRQNNLSWMRPNHCLIQASLTRSTHRLWTNRTNTHGIPGPRGFRVLGRRHLVNQVPTPQSPPLFFFCLPSPLPERIQFFSSGFPQTLTNPPASASPVLRLQAVSFPCIFLCRRVLVVVVMDAYSLSRFWVRFLEMI